MRNILQFILIGLIKLYRLSFSKILPTACRHYPSCSQYSLDAINFYGPYKGFAMSIIRILKCNPFFSGGIDEVIVEKKK
ncbi:MAG: membrane protein insertion efficiency factor YidD [Thermodesulfobacteriota bacterium]|nr:membrane protein insertion efficiency factor YidD [Thermodesulfobacteriota bacterium]MEE2975657.1 membrane protein insertion efficiency factor YidD [Thermodesulfobacteriota bacterium]|tara:strand:+ start:4741 stop:4977 length:237 start_codon:yes stop_codon:yes gene_type:complete